MGHTNLNPRCNIANWGTLPTVEIFKIISILEQEIMLGDSPHIQVQFSAKVVMFRRIFHSHSRPQNKDKPFPAKLGRGNYIGNYPPIGVVGGYRECGSLR